MINVILEALDGKPITTRTGKSKVKAHTTYLPEEGGYHIFFYANEMCDSTGVAIATDNVEKINNEIIFVDDKKRKFKITIIES